MGPMRIISVMDASIIMQPIQLTIYLAYFVIQVLGISLIRKIMDIARNARRIVSIALIMTPVFNAIRDICSIVFPQLNRIVNVQLPIAPIAHQGDNVLPVIMVLVFILKAIYVYLV
jgi:hypothetical protein